MRILVTGGGGYIGSHTAKALAAAGYVPVVLDNLSRGHRWAVKWGPLVEGELADTRFIRAVLKEHRIQAVVHFAAYAYVGESVRRPQEYFQNNAVNSLNLLDAMLAEQVSEIVFSSTCAVYGDADRDPITEDRPRQPVNPYGESKLFVERALAAYGEAYGLRSIALRYFNAAGADPDGELGEAHDPETHLVPLAIAAALENGRPLEIFGTDYPTRDGTAVRDYVHVSDLADAHVRALDRLRSGGGSDVFNLGTGTGHSVREIVDAVGKVAGHRIPTVDMPRRPGDPPALVANADKAARELGWAPRLSTLEAIVETAWKWHSGTARHGSAGDRARDR